MVILSRTIPTTLRPTFAEGEPAPGCLQKIKDLISRITQAVANFFKNLFYCFKKKPAPSETERVQASAKSANAVNAGHQKVPVPAAAPQPKPQPLPPAAVNIAPAHVAAAGAVVVQPQVQALVPAPAPAAQAAAVDVYPERPAHYAMADHWDAADAAASAASGSANPGLPVSASEESVPGLLPPKPRFQAPAKVLDLTSHAYAGSDQGSNVSVLDRRDRKDNSDREFKDGRGTGSSVAPPNVQADIDALESQGAAALNRNSTEFVKRPPKAERFWPGGESVKDPEVGAFAVFAALTNLWISIAQGMADTLTSEAIANIITGAINVHTKAKQAAGDTPLDFGNVLASYPEMKSCKLAVLPDKYEDVDLPTVVYDTMDEAAFQAAKAAAEASGDTEEVSRPEAVGNKYAAGIEARILALRATATQSRRKIIGGILFKGNDDNPKPYGVIVHFNETRNNYDYYLYDPYGTKNDKTAIFCRFLSEATFTRFFVDRVPAPVEEYDNNYYAIRAYYKK